MTVKTMDIEGFDGRKGSEEIKRLRSVNALWEYYYPKWCFYLSAYEGGEDFACSTNLFKHQRENEADYRDRCARIHNMNYCESLVDYFTNFIFSEPIDRNGGGAAEYYREFVKDVNLKRENIDAFMKQVCEDMQIFGMVYILVDAPVVQTDGAPITKQDEKDQNLRPYWVLVKPSEITDWVTDEFDSFLYAKRKQFVTDIIGGAKASIERYTEFYPDRYVVTDVNITNPDKPQVIARRVLDNTTGVVPLVVARFKRSKKEPFVGLSFLRDFAYNNREIINLTSLLQEFLYRQAFNILAKEVDPAIPMQDQEEGVIGTANVIEVPKGASMPEYISPPADPAKFIQDERQRIKQEMFTRAAQDAVSEMFNGMQSSGFSQAQSFSKTVPFISSRADTLEAVENELMNLTMKMAGKEWNGKIKYKDRYELTNLTDALTQFQIIVRDLMLPSETFVKEELKRIVREYDGKLPSEVLAKIEKEIEEMKFESWSGSQKQALVGRGTSPGEQQKPKETGTMEEHQAEAKMPGNAATNKVKE